MKHRFLWLICLLLCIGIASVAMADTPTIQATMETRDGTNSTLVNAIIPQNEGDGDWYYDTWAASIAFDSENYDALCSKYGGTPTWTISDDGGLEVELFPEYATGAREDGYCGIRIFGAPEQTEDSHDYTICITCSWGELSQTYPLTVTYEKTDRIPNGCNIPPVITLKVNETSTFNWTFNDGYEYKGAYWYPAGLNEDDYSFYELFELSNDGTSVSITPTYDNADYWYGWLKIADGNVGVCRNVLFILENEYGDYDNEDRRLPFRFEDDSTDGAELTFAIFDDTDAVSHDSWVYDFVPYDFDNLCAIFGEPVSYWVDILNDPEYENDPLYRTDVCCHMDLRDANDPWRDQYLWIDETPADNGFTMFRVGLLWEDDELGHWYEYQDFRINWERVSDLPQGTNIPSSYIYLTVGQEQTLTFDYDHAISFQGRDRINSWLLGDLSADFERWDSDGFSMTFKPNETGLFPAAICLIRGNLTTYNQVILCVKDENNNVPDLPDLFWEDSRSNNYEIDFALFEDQYLGDGVALYHDNWVMNFFLPEDVYYIYQTLYGGEPEFSHFLNEGNQDVVYSTYVWGSNDDDDTVARGMDIFIDEYPEEECSIVIEVACSWGDKELSGRVTVNFRNAALPTGLTTPETIELTVGDDYSFTMEDLLPEGYAFSRQKIDDGLFGMDVSDFFDTWDEWNNSDDDYIQHVSPREPGVYLGWIHYRQGNMVIDRNVTYRVQDDNGYVPELEMGLQTAQTFEEFAILNTFYDGSPESFLHTEDILFNAWIDWDFYSILWDQTQSYPEWTVEQIEGDDFGWNWDEWWETDGHDCFGITGRLNDMPETETNATFRITCSWNGFEESRELSFHFVNKALPTAFTADSVVNLTVGQPGMVNYSIEPADWVYSSNRYFDAWVIDNNGNGDDWGLLSCDLVDGSLYITAREAGAYAGYICLRDGSVNYIYRPVQFIVADEDGNVPPEIQPKFDKYNYEINFYLDDDNNISLWYNGDPVYTGDQLVSVDLLNYDALALMGGDVTWTQDWLDEDGPRAIVDIEPYEDNRGAVLKLTELPQEETTAGFRIYANWNGQSYGTDVFVHFIKAGMPEGIDFPSVIELNEGDTWTYTASFLPDSWNLLEDESYIDCGFHNGGYDGDEVFFDNDGNTVTITANRAGTYYLYADLWSWNICATNPWIELRVRDAEGNVPQAVPMFAEQYDIEYASVVSNTEDYPYDWWRSDGDVLFIWPDNWDVMTTLYGDDYEWSFEQLSGAAVHPAMGWDDNLGFHFLIQNLDEIPANSDASLRATMRWGDVSSSCVINVHFIDMSLPDILEFPTEINFIVNEVGRSELELEPLGFCSNYFYYIDLYGSGAYVINWWSDNVENPIAINLLASESGRYYGSSHVHADNVFIWSPAVTFIVYDEEGFVPSLAPVFFDPVYDTMRYLLPESGEGITWPSRGIMGVNIDNREEMIAAYGDTAQWNVEYVSGPVVTPYIEPPTESYSYARILIEDLPTETGTTTLRVDCEWGDATDAEGNSINTASVDIMIYFENWIENEDWPTGNTFPSELSLDVGESVELTCELDSYGGDWTVYLADLEFDDNGVIEVEQLDNQTLRITGMEPGSIEVKGCAWIGWGVCAQKTMTITVGTVLTLPASLTEIDEEAFEGISAQMVVIPGKVTSIGSRAFANCPNLQRVEFEGNVASIADNAFEGCPDGLTIISSNDAMLQWGESKGYRVKGE